MTPSAPLFLRHKDGEPLGPLTPRALEVLYDSRVVDDDTPVSTDGVIYRALSEHADLWSHVLEIKERLGKGENPWTSLDSGVAQPVTTADLSQLTPLRVIVGRAAAKATGRVVFQGRDGTVEITFRDGKIATVETAIDSLAMPKFLQEDGAVDKAALDSAIERAPSVGGDLGAALISMGLIQPHVYFEKVVAWAIHVLGAVLAREMPPTGFFPEDVGAPAFPLGFDRFGVAIEAVRRGLSRQTLSERILPKRSRPLILSQVEGVNLDECKLQPKELRALNAVDGVKTVAELLESFGGDDDATLAVLRAVFFSEQAGFVVFGDDPLHKQENLEAQQLFRTAEHMANQSYFETLGVNERSSDDDVRQKYAELAKKYHPDKLRPEAAPELLKARRELFGIISEAFAALELEDARYQYANDVEQGRAGNTEDLMKVQNVLQAETLFKKGEILVKVRKYDEALSHIDQAIGLNDDDIEFKIYRAYVRYLKNAKSEGVPAAERAIREILGLMKTQANIASGYLFLGHLNKAVNKPEVALRYFSKVLEYDESNQEAIGEVRIGNLRKDRGKKKKRWPTF